MPLCPIGCINSKIIKLIYRKKCRISINTVSLIFQPYRLLALPSCTTPRAGGRAGVLGAGRSLRLCGSHRNPLSGDFVFSRVLPSPPPRPSSLVQPLCTPPQVGQDPGSLKGNTRWNKPVLVGGRRTLLETSGMEKH